MSRFFSSRDSCPAIKNILILDSEGKRVAVKYYSDEWPTNSSRLAFEKSLFTKSLKSNARDEVCPRPPFLCNWGDEENELILVSVLQGLYDTIALLLRATFIDKREALENLDLIFLCIDEIVDQGMILETDANVLAGKVAIQSMDVSSPLSEQMTLLF
ncbi:hypothetical protein COLO4_15524 [Corchorus olitorius]|uniref:Coatomer subunit zeta n=1 Tax=Corchorus olitorius TaxID=93759 RepID=A0A1R3JMR5_9ROSI|nr:hypothetical protein COLO4_15524 [Corchorus olitorius]